MDKGLLWKLTEEYKSFAIDGNFTFLAYVGSEPETRTFDNEKMEYQVAYIFDDFDKPIFLLDVTDIKSKLPANSYAVITGNVVGTVCLKDSKKKVWDLKVHKMELFAGTQAFASNHEKIRGDISGKTTKTT